MNIVIYLYNGLTVLDAVGPYEVLSRLPDANVKFVAREKGLIISDTHFLKLVAEYEIAEIQSADILVIPGSVIGFIRESKDAVILNWVQKNSSNNNMDNFGMFWVNYFSSSWNSKWKKSYQPLGYHIYVK